MSPDHRFAEVLRSIGNQLFPGPPSSLSDVRREVARRALRRRRGQGLAAVAVFAAVAVTAAVTATALLEGTGDRQPPASGPTGEGSSTEESSEAPSPNDCAEIPFRPSELPLGIGGMLTEGSSSAPDREPPNVRGTWMGYGPGNGIDVIGSSYAATGTPERETKIDVLGGSATLATDDDVHAVNFSVQDCDWALVGYGIPRRDLRRMAESLIPSTEEDRSACREKGIPFRSPAPPPGWSTDAEDAEAPLLGIFTAAPEGEQVSVALSEDAAIGITGAEPIEVLGEEGRIGGWDEGTAAIFHFRDCNYTLAATPEVRPSELREFAESLRPGG